MTNTNDTNARALAAFQAEDESAGRLAELLDNIPRRGPGRAVHGFAVAVRALADSRQRVALKRAAEAQVDSAARRGRIDATAAGLMLDALAAAFRLADAADTARLAIRALPSAMPPAAASDYDRELAAARRTA